MDGREPQLLFLISFLASFGFIRTSAHMIRAQVSWWPGNVQVGGTHIHHLVWGICLILICGYVGTVERPDSPWWHVAIIGFGIGTGLAMDEFALWLNLRDVYWEEEGRRSIDAVIVVAILAGMAVVGFREWVDAAESVEDEIFGIVAGAGVIVFLVALVNAAKEKFGMALLSILVAPIGIVAAFRLAKPTSLWARAFYSEAKLVRARERFG
jgi:hypothetical protein